VEKQVRDSTELAEVRAAADTGPFDERQLQRCQPIVRRAAEISSASFDLSISRANLLAMATAERLTAPQSGDCQ
jgi:hypothetical protein